MKKSITRRLFGKKEKCTHHWHHVGKTSVDSYLGYDTAIDRKNVLFCPKCEEEIVVSNERWEQLQAIQKVREAYNETTVLDTPASTSIYTPISNIIDKPSVTKRARKPVTAKK